MKAKRKKKTKLPKKKAYHELRLFVDDDGIEVGNCYWHECIDCKYSCNGLNDFPCNRCGRLINTDKCYFDKAMG